MGYIPKPDNVSHETWNKYLEDWNTEWTHKYSIQRKALKELGYEFVEHVPHKYKYLGPDGNTYIGPDKYKEKFGFMPGFRKDGVWYGHYETIEKHNLGFKMTTQLPIADSSSS
jgi:hypothetical protein